MTKQRIIQTQILIAFCFSCVAVNGQSSLPAQWQSFLDSIYTHHSLTGILVHVDAPRKNISWSGAAGITDKVSMDALTGRESVRIASITKSYVAAAILRLREEGMLNIDDPVTKHISQTHIGLLKEGGYIPEEISIRHLLTHTSGLFDHGSSNAYISRILDDPQHRWTRTEQIQGSMLWGRPVGKPGERYSYSDTGYLLLGEVIEKITGKSLGIALRELLAYRRNAMDETWFEITETKPRRVAARVHQYLDTIDTYHFHPSLDLYGGGGVVTTMQDLTDFYRALFTGNVYAYDSTLTTMLAPVAKASSDTPSLDYRMGIFRQEVLGMEAWTHSGFWGVQVWYLPDPDAAIAIAVTRQEDFRYVRKVLEFLVESITQ